MIRFASAAILLLSYSASLSDLVVVPSVESSFTTGPDDPGSAAEISVPMPPTLPNFSILGETEFCLKFQAPAGYLFHSSFPEGGYFAAEFFPTGSFSGDGDSFFDASPDISFSGFNGTIAPTSFMGTYSLPGPGGAGGFVEVFSFPTAGDEFSFQSVSICTTIPAIYDIDFTAASTEKSLVRGFIPGNSDYGQFVSLQAIPEPSAFAFVGLIGLVAGGRNWRNRRR